MRDDVLAHGYFAIDLEIVWRAVHDAFPRDRARLEAILDELPPDA